MPTNEPVIKNQFFVGVPWKDIRSKFDRALNELKQDYPVHCVVFGRNTGQDADDLWHSIQKEVQVSAATIFDVTGSNPNVALEFGFAEALGKQRVLTRYERKPRKKSGSPAPSPAGSIMSDLAGKIRMPYKNIKGLKKILKKEFERNPYVVQFRRHVRSQGLGKRAQKVAVAMVQQLARGKRMTRADLIMAVETLFPNVTTVDIPKLVNELKAAKLLVTKKGRHGGISIPTLK